MEITVGEKANLKAFVNQKVLNEPWQLKELENFSIEELSVIELQNFLAIRDRINQLGISVWSEVPESETKGIEAKYGLQLSTNRDFTQYSIFDVRTYLNVFDTTTKTAIRGEWLDRLAPLLAEIRILKKELASAKDFEKKKGMLSNMVGNVELKQYPTIQENIILTRETKKELIGFTKFSNSLFVIIKEVKAFTKIFEEIGFPFDDTFVFGNITEQQFRDIWDLLDKEEVENNEPSPF